MSRVMEDSHPANWPVRQSSPVEGFTKSCSVILPLNKGGMLVSSCALKTLMEVAGYGRMLPDKANEVHQALLAIEKSSKSPSEYRGISKDSELAFNDWHREWLESMREFINPKPKPVQEPVQEPIKEPVQEPAGEPVPEEKSADGIEKVPEWVFEAEYSALLKNTELAKAMLIGPMLDIRAVYLEMGPKIGIAEKRALEAVLCDLEALLK